MADLYLGIDLSMVCPALCFQSGAKTSFEDCDFHYLIGKPKKYIGGEFAPNITGWEMPDWNHDAQRYDNISAWVIGRIEGYACKYANVERNWHVFIEGYSMGSKGQVFNIGENGGVVKHKIYKYFGAPATDIPPTTVKMKFQGKGNATKLHMLDAFEAVTGVSLINVFEFTRPVSEKSAKTKNWTPIGDICDSYAVVMTGRKSLDIAT